MGDESQRDQAVRPVHDFLRFGLRAHDELQAAHDGTKSVLAFDALLRKYADDAFFEKQDEKKEEVRRQRVARARRVQTHGFPVLYGSVLFGIWGALEACIDDVVLAQLQSGSREHLQERLKGVKVSLGEFLFSDEADRWVWVLEQLRRSCASSSQPGVAQHEALLATVGLDGAVAPEIKRLLLVTKSLRNVFAHRGGIWDQKADMESPGTVFLVGDPVRLTGSQLGAVVDAMAVYAGSVMDRIEVRYGGEPKMSEDLETGSETLANLLSHVLRS